MYICFSLPSNCISRIYIYNYWFQFVAVILGLIYLRIKYDQRGVMNINGAIFLLITNASFTSLFAVVNVSIYGFFIYEFVY